jgi:hypothetical protein
MLSRGLEALCAVMGVLDWRSRAPLQPPLGGHLSGSSCRAPPAASATSSGGGELYAIRVYIVALPFSSAVPYGRSVECGAAGQPAHKGRGL